MSEASPKVDFYFAKESKWRTEYGKLRTIVLGCGLTENLKWGHPCYTVGNRNVVLIHGFKDYCALLFHQGALLEDPARILVQQTPNVQSARQARFSGPAEIVAAEATLKAYIREAVEVENEGRRVPLKQTQEFDMPEEFRERLADDPALREAFGQLTPGRQRGYLLHFSGAKQAKTRESRIAKHLEAILAGRGLDD